MGCPHKVASLAECKTGVESTYYLPRNPSGKMQKLYRNPIFRRVEMPLWGFADFSLGAYRGC
jgi:hypothetical protein